MDTSSDTLTGALILGVVGLISKIVWDWLNRNNSKNNSSPIVGDWGAVTYLKTVIPQLIERMDKMTSALGKIEEKTHKINEDNSVTDDKTGRKLIYVPSSLIDDMNDLKVSSIESNAILKQINDTLTRFFTINSESLSKQNQALNKQNEILTDLRLSLK